MKKHKFYRETPPLTKDDSFLFFDRVKDSFDFPIHYHVEFELNFISNGKGVKRVVGDHMEEIDDLELVLVGPNLVHGWELYNCKSKEIHEITIQFHGSLFHESLLARRIMAPIKEMFNRAAFGILFSKKTTEELAPKLVALSKSNNMDYFIEILSILYDMANSRGQRLLNTNVSSADIIYEDDEKMKLLYSFIEKNYSNKITLEEVAVALNMTTISFSRFIKKRTGKTYVNFLNEVRISYATRCLIEKDLTVSEIAFMCGFNNIANFNRTFKALKNTTPTQYKEDFYGLKRFL